LAVDSLADSPDENAGRTGPLRVIANLVLAVAKIGFRIETVRLLRYALTRKSIRHYVSHL